MGVYLWLGCVGGVCSVGERLYGLCGCIGAWMYGWCGPMVICTVLVMWVVWVLGCMYFCG